MSDRDYKALYEGLVQQLNNDGGLDIYPQGHMTEAARNDAAMKKTDAYKCGWNDAAMESTDRRCKILERAAEGLSNDLTMLLASDCCFLNEDGTLSLNMNDTWMWGCSDLPSVPDDQLAEVARLFRCYGHAGLMYYHSCRKNDMRSEFHDNNRMVDFVRHEENIKKEYPDCSKRAYKKVVYTLGEK